jgi:hypothetical protein
MDTLTHGERMRVGAANMHAFRHTIDTRSVAEEVPG